MALRLRPNFPPFIQDENGHIPTADDTANWLVIVTKEAMEEVASPPDASHQRLLEHIGTFGEVATYKLEHGRAGDEDTIWVQKEDVAKWRRTRSNRL
ncbi:hypothetical protein [Rhizobium sp. IBUN]|uniref:hypothetical protein n=1 Tax=Rhizobium sp. IBUN TaxID=1042326 RepID=UPI0004707E1E|nr:hypothetical protein [Rhizobium sp. IBUN]